MYIVPPACIYEHVKLPAKMPSAFATSPPSMSSLIHTLTILSHIAVVAPAVLHFPVPSALEYLLPLKHVFEAPLEPKEEPYHSLVTPPAKSAEHLEKNEQYLYSIYDHVLKLFVLR